MIDRWNAIDTIEHAERGRLQSARAANPWFLWLAPTGSGSSARL